MQENYLQNPYFQQSQYQYQNPMYAAPNAVQQNSVVQTQAQNQANSQCPLPQGPNAVSINIYQPQAYTQNPNGQTYSMYGTNSNPALPLYPQNYNNMIQQQPLKNALNKQADKPLLQKTPNPEINGALDSETKEASKEEKTQDKKDKDKKTKTLLTDDYIKSLENYLDNDNPQIRLIGVKELLERFKEDDNRKSHPSLTPLLNKALRDSSASVRFLALTALQIGYATGNDETISILKEIQSTNQDKFGQDSILASEILLKLSAPKIVEDKE